MHDVIVVGGGGSGIPLAARLADAGASVLLLEAGPTTGLDDPALTDARLVPGARTGHRGTVAHPVELGPNRPWTVQRGMVLGGSTAVNGGYFVRARRDDFERWSSAGGPGWNYDAVLPHLRRLERDLVHGAGPVHGADGPVPVGRTDVDSGWAAAFVDTARALGFDAESDKNAQGLPGVGSLPINVENGRRVSTAAAYLTSPRTTLTILGDTPVHRVRISDGRAVGVETANGFWPAGRVVLSAGAYGSAALLFASGVGPAGRLATAGLRTVVDLPVGTAASDHPQLVLEWTGPQQSGPQEQTLGESWLGGALHTTTPGSTFMGDVEILQSLLPMASLTSGSTHSTGTSLLVSSLRPAPHGQVVPTTSGTPLVRFDHLRDPDVRAGLRHGVRTAVAILRSGAFAAGQDTGPDDRTLDDDAALDAWLAVSHGTALHLCGTTPMGPVVDGTGAIHGIAGLHVADTGILPAAPLRGPANTAVLIGEVVAAALTRPG